MPCLVSLGSQRVLLICGDMLGRLILLLITDKLQNQVLSQPLDRRELKCLVNRLAGKGLLLSLMYNKTHVVTLTMLEGFICIFVDQKKYIL